jgi:hypothetical protein
MVRPGHLRAESVQNVPERVEVFPFDVLVTALVERREQHGVFGYL